jgi:hypothetical protein
LPARQKWLLACKAKVAAACKAKVAAACKAKKGFGAKPQKAGLGCKPKNVACLQGEKNKEIRGIMASLMMNIRKL